MGIEPDKDIVRVANIIEEGRWGGPQKRISMIAAELKNYAIDTTVLLPEKESAQFCAALDENKISWLSLSMHRLGREITVLFAYFFTFLQEIFKLKKMLEQGNFDLVHVSGGAWQIKGIIASRLAGLPILWHLNDTKMPAPVVCIFRVLGRLADAFAIASTRVRQLYLSSASLSASPVYSIPAPVDTKAYDKSRVIADAELLERQSPRIVIVANVNPVKGLETLLSAAFELKKQRNKFSVSIVGAIFDSQQKYYESLCALVEKYGLDGYVFFDGTRNNIPEVLAAAEIYVCSSIAEASPMSVWEAMSMSCAIVSTDVGDVSNFIEHGKDGFITPVSDHIAMSTSIEKYIRDTALRREYGDSARKKACETLDIRVVGRITAQCYLSVLKNVRE